jgi:hypothetical protein
MGSIAFSADPGHVAYVESVGADPVTHLTLVVYSEMNGGLTFLRMVTDPVSGRQDQIMSRTLGPQSAAALAYIHLG